MGFVRITGGKRFHREQPAIVAKRMVFGSLDEPMPVSFAMEFLARGNNEYLHGNRRMVLERNEAGD
jgi:hypothetical protein